MLLMKDSENGENGDNEGNEDNEKNEDNEGRQRRKRRQRGKLGNELKDNNLKTLNLYSYLPFIFFSLPILPCSFQRPPAASLLFLLVLFRSSQLHIVML